MADQEYRLLFEENYSVPFSKSKCPIDPNYDFIKDDPYFKNKNASVVNQLAEFVNNCILLSIMCRAEISIDLCEENGEVMVFLSAKHFSFSSTGTMLLSSVCASSNDIKIITSDKEYEKTLICISFETVQS
jgi:hypothetical protein